jgi:fatty acid CoA ligase FadD9
VDWLIDAGYTIERISDYTEWKKRLHTVMQLLPDVQRKASLLPLMQKYQRPEKPLQGAIAPAVRFRAAAQHAKIGPDKDIPHITSPIILNYTRDLQLLGLL